MNNRNVHHVTLFLKQKITSSSTKTATCTRIYPLPLRQVTSGSVQ